MIFGPPATPSLRESVIVLGRTGLKPIGDRGKAHLVALAAWISLPLITYLDKPAN